MQFEATLDQRTSMQNLEQAKSLPLKNLALMMQFNLFNTATLISHLQPNGNRLVGFFNGLAQARSELYFDGVPIRVPATIRSFSVQPSTQLSLTDLNDHVKKVVEFDDFNAWFAALDSKLINHKFFKLNAYGELIGETLQLTQLNISLQTNQPIIDSQLDTGMDSVMDMAEFDEDAINLMVNNLAIIQANNNEQLGSGNSTQLPHTIFFKGNHFLQPLPINTLSLLKGPYDEDPATLSKNINDAVLRYNSISNNKNLPYVQPNNFSDMINPLQYLNKEYRFSIASTQSTLKIYFDNRLKATTYLTNKKNELIPRLNALLNPNLVNSDIIFLKTNFGAYAFNITNRELKYINDDLAEINLDQKLASEGGSINIANNPLETELLYIHQNQGVVYVSLIPKPAVTFYEDVALAEINNETKTDLQSIINTLSDGPYKLGGGVKFVYGAGALNVAYGIRNSTSSENKISFLIKIKDIYDFYREDAGVIYRVGNQYFHFTPIEKIAAFKQQVQPEAIKKDNYKRLFILLENEGLMKRNILFDYLHTQDSALLMLAKDGNYILIGNNFEPNNNPLKIIPRGHGDRWRIGGFTPRTLALHLDKMINDDFIKSKSTYSPEVILQLDSCQLGRCYQPQLNDDNEYFKYYQSSFADKLAEIIVRQNLFNGRPVVIESSENITLNYHNDQIKEFDPNSGQPVSNKRKVHFIDPTNSLDRKQKLKVFNRDRFDNERNLISESYYDLPNFGRRKVFQGPEN